MKLQVTFFCNNGKYKPVAAIVQPPSSYHYIKNKDYWIHRAKLIVKAKRHWTDEDMEKYGYTDHKVMIIKEEDKSGG